MPAVSERPVAVATVPTREWAPSDLRFDSVAEDLVGRRRSPPPTAVKKHQKRALAMGGTAVAASVLLLVAFPGPGVDSEFHPSLEGGNPLIEQPAP